MAISFKSHNIPKLKNFEQKKNSIPKIISAPLINHFEDLEIKQENQQFKNIVDDFSFFQEPKNLNIKNNQINNWSSSIEIKKDNWKNKKKSRKKKERKKKNFEMKNENLIDTSFDEINQNQFNECNMFNTNQIFSNSQNLNVNKEIESEETTSFASDNNLSSNLTNSYNINSVEKKQRYVNNNRNDIYENYVNYLKNIDRQKYYEHEISLDKNYNNVVIFPNDLKLGKKNNKKKKKKNHLKNNNNINIINNYYVDMGNNINNIINIPNNLSKENNYMISNLNSNINYNYNSNSNINYNNIEKTNKNSQIIFSGQNFFNKKNGLSIKQDNSNYFNENKIKENIEQSNINSKSILDKKNENENRKKYIYMSDILAYAPIKINQSSKPFIINEQYKKKQILLNLKIKIPNSDNYIEIHLKEDENPLLIFNNLKLDSTDSIKKIIYEKIEQSIYLIKYFKNLALTSNSVNEINELYKNINIIN